MKRQVKASNSILEKIDHFIDGILDKKALTHGEMEKFTRYSKTPRGEKERGIIFAILYALFGYLFLLIGTFSCSVIGFLILLGVPAILLVCGMVFSIKGLWIVALILVACIHIFSTIIAVGMMKKRVQDAMITMNKR